MAIRISNIRVPMEFPEKDLFSRALTIIGISAEEVEHFSLLRLGLDARRKGELRRVCTVDLSLRSPELEERVCSRVASACRVPPAPDPFFRVKGVRTPPVRPVVVGAGPAGLFASLTLARFGAPPLLLERGRPVEERTRHVAAFWKSGAIDPESNVQFGEGGAGTFSDGKLTTRIGDPLVAHVVGIFEEFAGLPGLRVEARPHVGSDRLKGFCLRMREELSSKGALLRYGARVDGIDTDGGRVRGLRLSTGEEIPCDHLLLAIGHSARDTERMLLSEGVKMSPKAFAVGFRAEHPQELIDRIQYGKAAGRPGLPPADYRLTARAPSGRGIYSFCMCPGGEVMAASSGPGEMPVNGMSTNARGSGRANSGIVVTVSPADFGGGEVFAGVRFQEAIEARAFRKGGGGFGIPAMNLAGFLEGKDRNLSRGRALAPRVTRANLSGILPGEVEDDLRFGLLRFGETLRGFHTQEATLYAVESRTSSPVRIERENYESVTLKGLYPVGEGAGYAGGIVSSAVDGIRGALRILEKLSG